MHGFAFSNAWVLDTDEVLQMQEVLIHAIQRIPSSSCRSLLGLGESTITTSLQRWASSALPQRYGLCGGMCFAALDYYQAGYMLPRGIGYNDRPGPHTADREPLYRYLWRRQIASMVVNMPTFLTWMIALHSRLPPAGPRWLLERTRNEWITLKEQLYTNQPCPLGLVGSTTNPFCNHQVLAYACDDPGDGTSRISVYDPNCPDNEHTITCDFRGTELLCHESCPSSRRGPLRGFFCEVYTFALPPLLTTHN